MMPKFRAWDNYRDEMISWDELLCEPYKKLKDLNDVPLEFMQSTSLYDKNGVEIFDGDIVSHFDGEFSYKGVVTQDGVTCWWIKGIEPDDNFRFDDVTDYTYYTCDLVVKGNIYENPELLEDV